VIIPFLGLILGIGFIVIILTVLNILPFLVADIFGGLINIMNQFINFISRQEIFIFHDIPFSLLLMLLFYMTFFLGLHLILNKIFKNIILFLTGIILLQSGLFYQKKKIQKSSEFIVFDQYKKTMIGLRNGENLIIWRDIQKDQTGQNQVLKDYKTGAEIKNNQEINILQNFYLIDKERILVIDSTDIYLKKFDPSIVILCRNPKINLERMIRDLKPGIIITDHTIFPDLADRWQQTCEKYNIVFYRTPLQGAFQHRY
jgi:competence protein ComEC